MQRPTSLALLAALCSLASATGSSRLPRGVGPEFASRYQESAEFGCLLNPSIKVGWDKVNDNSCDCPDGSDEPGTAACAHLDPLSPPQPLAGSASGTTNTTTALPGFWCANEGHVGAYLPFSYVNDGVCDYDICCDGSDEYGAVGGTRCENRCLQVGREHRQAAEEKRKTRERAGKKREALVLKAGQLRRQAEARVVELEESIGLLDIKKADLQRRHATAEMKDRNRTPSGAQGKFSALIERAKGRAKQLRDGLEDAVTERDRLQTSLQELERMLGKLLKDYNPNFNDEGVKAAVKAYQDYAARQDGAAEEQGTQQKVDQLLQEEADSGQDGFGWAQFEEAAQELDAGILQKVEARLPAFVGDGLAQLRVWLVQNGLLAETARSGSESALVKAAREAVEAAQRDFDQQVEALRTAKEDLAKDYGPQDIFRALRGQCTSTEAGEYTYELCWLAAATQKSNKGHGDTLMGTFAAVDRALADDAPRADGRSLGSGPRLVLRYENGQGCWNGPLRRTDVWLACADKDELWRVSEAEKCVYRMEVGSPAACEPEPAPPDAHAKDEL